MSSKAVTKPVYGGRALPDGVLMVGPSAFAVSVRKADGSIGTAVQPFNMPMSWARSVPFLRGLLAIGGALVLMLRSGKLERGLSTASGGRRRQVAMTMAPIVAASVLERMVSLAFVKRKRAGGPQGRNPSPVNPIMPLLAFRLTGFTPAGRRLLQYHAAEHMAVNAAENGQEVTAHGAASQSRIHPRCGTTFAFWAMLIGARLTSKGQVKGMVKGAAVGAFTISLAYEIARFGSAHREKSWAKILFGPSWQAQRLTTIPPDPEHLEVACAALRAVQAHDPKTEESPTGIV